MESRSCRDDVVFCRADRSFRTVRVFDIGGYKFPPKLHCRRQVQKGLALLVVHPDGINQDAMGAEELDGSTQGDSGVLSAEAH
jgi:hypothetical protein